MIFYSDASGLRAAGFLSPVGMAAQGQPLRGAFIGDYVYAVTPVQVVSGRIGSENVVASRLDLP